MQVYRGEMRSLQRLVGRWLIRVSFTWQDGKDRVLGCWGWKAGDLRYGAPEMKIVSVVSGLPQRTHCGGGKRVSVSEMTSAFVS